MDHRKANPWSLAIAPELGARLASLRDPSGREWLWRNPDPAVLEARTRVGPGAPFVDAGGWEECFPTIAGEHDHGEVWSRPWGDANGELSVVTGEYSLRRDIRAGDSRLTARYRLEAEPGFRFIWAAHLLLDLSPDAHLEAAPGTRCRLWPGHWRARSVPAREGPWPAPLGKPLDRLVPDGSALFFMLLDPAALTVVDGQRLTVSLDAPGQPRAIAVWRNLGGWPPEAPYRTIGIEPAIGHHYDRGLAAPADLGVVGSSGMVEWTLNLDAGEPVPRDRT